MTRVPLANTLLHYQTCDRAARHCHFAYHSTLCNIAPKWLLPMAKMFLLYSLNRPLSQRPAGLKFVSSAYTQPQVAYSLDNLGIHISIQSSIHPYPFKGVALQCIQLHPLDLSGLCQQ